MAIQCSKLTVHSAPGAHIFAAGRMFSHMCAHVFSPNCHSYFYFFFYFFYFISLLQVTLIFQKYTKMVGIYI